MLLLLLPLFTATAFANPSAIAWLNTQQQDDGRFAQAGDIATSLQASTETLRTLHALSAGQRQSTTAALAFVDAGLAEGGTEYLARALIAHLDADSPGADIVSALQAQQNSDGGFGGAAGFTSNALDTAYALEALLKTPASRNEVIAAGIAYLTARQNTDGSYAPDRYGHSAAYTTALALMALHNARLRFDLAQPIDKASRFLLSAQDSAGGWGEDFETAWALLALAPATTDATPLAAAVRQLAAAQGADGSWNQDVYRTALAARALQVAQGADTPASWDGALVGRVIDQATGLPLGGVDVTIGSGQAAKSGADGYFSLQGIAPGVHQVGFALAGYAATARTADLSTGQQLDLGAISMTVLADVGVITGVVTDAANGQPLVGALVTLSGATEINAITDAAGGYRLTAPPGAYSMVAAQAGYLNTTASASVAAGVALTFSPALTESAGQVPTTVRLSGTVVDAATGLPLSGVDVAAASGAIKVATDTTGGFSLTGLSAGTVDLSLNLAGYQGVHLSLIAPVGMSQLGIIRLAPLTATGGTGVLIGNVTDAASGTPVVGAKIRMTGATSLETLTNAQGAYRLVALPGTYTVIASASGYRDVGTTATLAAGASLTFSPSLPAAVAPAPTTTNLSGTVVDAGTGQPLAGALIAAAGGALSAVTDADGKFMLADLTPGAWVLDLSLYGYQGLRISLTAPAGNSDLGNLRLQAAPTNGNALAGIVTDTATGAPLAGALVSLAGESKSTHTAADGSYRIDGIASNQFTVAVSATGYLSRQGSVSLAQPGLYTLNVDLPRAATTGLDIATALPAQSAYPARSKIAIQTQLTNTTDTDRQVRLYAVIVDAAGQVVEQFPAKTVGLGGNPADALETVPANGSATIMVDWHNGATTPGWYQVTLQAYDGMTGQLLSERSAPVEILPTLAIGGSTEFNPPIAQLAAKQPVKLSATIENRGNLNVSGGTVTAKVTLKNQGYQSANRLLEIETLLDSSLNYPQGIDRDSVGNFYVVNNVGGALIKVDKTGTATVIASGFIYPVDVDVAANGDIYVLSSSNYYERLTANGGRQQFPTGGLISQQAIEVRADGRVLIATASAGIYEFSPAGKTLLPITGLGQLKEIQADAQGKLYIGDYSNGIIYRINDDNSLTTLQTDLPKLETFAIADDGRIAAVYNSKDLALISATGTKETFANSLPSPLANIYGIAWDNEHNLVVSTNGNRLQKILLPLGTHTLSVGETVYTRTIALPLLALGQPAIALDFGNWIPTLSGDFQVEVSVDGHPEYGSLFNALHVGPNARGDIAVATPSVRPGDRVNRATISLFGADSTSITRIDGSASTLAAISNANGRGVAADKQGNIYVTNALTASSIVKISPSGVVSTFATGYRFGYGLVIDQEGNLYSYSSVATEAATILKITPDGKVSYFSTLNGPVKGLAIGSDERLYAIDSTGALSSIDRNGGVRQIAKTEYGSGQAVGLTIDSNGYFYFPTNTFASMLDADGAKRSYRKIIRVSPDGKRVSIYYNHAIFEFEGVNVTADCSNNLLYAPTLDYPIKTSGEEDTLFQMIGDTGEIRPVLYGPSIDPSLKDMDVLFYDRFGQRLLIWTDLNNGKVFSFPVVCGGIAADVHLVTRGDVAVSGMNPAPNKTINLGGGRYEHVWNLKQVDNRGAQLQLDLLLKGLTENETRPIAEQAFVEFRNSFVPGQNVRTPLVIPSVLATTAMTLQPRLDAGQYGPLSPVNIQVDVTNSGADPFSGELRLGIVDAEGFPVQDLPPIGVNAQAAGATVSYPALWNTGLFLTGDYTLKASLVDENGAQVASGSTPFGIVSAVGVAQASGSLNPDKLIYAGWDHVNLNGAVTNSAINTLLPASVMTVTVAAPDGAVIYSGRADIAELAAGGSLPASFGFALSDAAAGDYHVTAQILNAADGAVLTTWQSQFAVVRTALQGLTGSLAVTPNPVTIGAALNCHETLQNQSASGIDAVVATSLVVRLNDGAVVSEQTRSLALAGKQTDSHDVGLATRAWTPGDYACVLRAAVGGNVKDLAADAFKVTIPDVTLSGAVFHDLDRNQAQALNEPGTSADGAWLTAVSNGAAVASVPVAADGRYQLTVPGLADYTLVITRAANATAASLPIGWNLTGESQAGTPDAAVDGQLTVHADIDPISALNFGVDGAGSSASTDRAVTAQGVAITVPVLANDRPGVGATRLDPARIDLDPGTEAVDTSATLAGEGSFSVLPEGHVRFTPLPGFSGVSELAYRVFDDLGQSTNPAQLRVTVAGPGNLDGDTQGDQPKANPDAGVTTVGAAITLNLTGNDVAALGASIDPTTLDLDTVSPGLQSQQTTLAGDWQALGDGSVSYTPAAGFSGAAEITYVIADSNGQIATAAVNVTVTGGDTAIAVADSAATRPSTAVNLAVFNNDAAAAGHVLDTVDLIPDTAAIDTGVDTDSGHWQVETDGSVTYLPATDFSGGAALSYAIADGSGQSATANIQIQVQPLRAPTALDDTADAAFNTAVTLRPSANDRAEPGAVLNPATLDLDPATDAVDTAYTAADGQWQARPDGSLIFTPALNQVGAMTPLGYLIRDSLGHGATAQVTVTVAPPASVTVSGRVFHDLDHNQQQSANEPGTDAGGLYVAAVAADGLAIAATAVAPDGAYQFEAPPLSTFELVLSNQSGGALAVLPTGWNVTGETQAGLADTMADGRLSVHTGVIAVAEMNFGIDGDPSQAFDDRAATAHGVDVSVAVLANDQAGPGTTGFNPASLDLNPATVAIDRQIDLAGQGRYSAQADGSVLFTPDPGFSGVSQINYQVQDSLGQTAAPASLSVAVGPAAVDDSLSTPAATPIGFNLAGNDQIPAGAAYSLTVAAAHGSAVVNADGSGSYTPALGYQGSDRFDYRVCLPAPDNALCAGAAVAITVTPPPIHIEGSLDAAAHGRLLVLVDSLDEACRPHQDDGDADNDADDGKDEAHPQQRDGAKDDDSEDDEGDCQRQQAERAYLARLLDAGGWTYTLTDSADAYTQALRGGSHNLTALLSAEVKLDESVQRELREAVNHGLGLLVSGDHDQRNNLLDSVLGIQYQGHSDAFGINIPASATLTGLNVNFVAPTDGIRISAPPASVLGRFTQARGRTGNPALTQQAYGLGLAAYLGFDLNAEAARQEPSGDGDLSRLLLELLNNLAPAPAYRAGDVIGLRLRLLNRGQAATGWADLDLAGTSVFDAGAAVPQADGRLRWAFSLAVDGQFERLAWARLPAEGHASAWAFIHADGQAREPYLSLNLDLPVTASPALNEALTMLRSIGKTDRRYASVYQSAQQADQYLQQSRWVEARAALLIAAEALIKIATPKAADARQAIDEALRRLNLEHPGDGHGHH